MTETHLYVQRGDTYKLLAACFYEPDKVMMLEEQVCRNLTKLLERIAPLAAPSAIMMEQSLHNLDQKRLSIDHAALFIGPFELIAAPYGSVWLEQRRRVMGDSTMDVQRFYADAGLSLDVSEPPDHIAIMLEFMYYLCRQEANAHSQENKNDVSHYQNLQFEFLTKALLPWVFRFCDAIEKKSDNPFYQSLAKTLQMFFNHEGEVIENKER